MRIRVVTSGIVSGVFCLIALWFPWYVVAPAELAPDWPFLNEAGMFPDWIPAAMTIFCALTIFAFGWVAARWNWSKTRRSSLLAGAGSGLIAGCVVYDFIGAFHFGLTGQADILKAFYRDVGEAEGLALLFDSISTSANLIYLNFILILFASTILGAFGGLASAMDLEDVWGKPPREPHRWLFRLSAYTLTLTGAGWLIVAIVAFSVFQDALNESMTTAAQEGSLTGLGMPPVFVSATALLTCYVMILPAIGLTWGWIVREWRQAGLWKLLYGLWIAASVYLAGWVLSGFVRYVATGMALDWFGFYPLTILWVVVAASLACGFLGGFLSEQTTGVPEKHNFYDWLGYALTQGILGGTQAFICIPAFALALALIAIENIPHLTQTGIVDRSPAQQIIQLFKVSSVTAQFLIVACAVGGWLFALFVLLIRKFLKIRPVAPQEPLVRTSAD